MNKVISITTIIIALVCLMTQSGEAQNAAGQRRFLPPMLQSGKIAAYVTFNRPLITQGMVMKNPAGVTYEEDVYLGSSGIKPGIETAEPYLYFQTAIDKLVTATGTFYISVQYLDLGQSSIQLEYFTQKNEEDVPEMESQSIFLGNSGFWEEHTFTVNFGIFDHLFENESDIRLFCPDVLIRHISISRLPLGKPKSQQFDTFRQPVINKPANYSFSVHVSQSTAKEFSENPSLIPSKVKLYQSWGAGSIVEKVDINTLYTGKSIKDVNPMVQRAGVIQQLGMAWVPRFKIGDIQQLPNDERGDLQRAVSANRNITGPMISIWEPKLPQVYTKLFRQLKSKSRTVPIPKLVLSFAGDVGPLFLTSEQKGGGSPSFWTGDPLARNHFKQYLRLQYGSLGVLSSHWNANISSWDSAMDFAASSQNSNALTDLITWYQMSNTALINKVIQSARSIFPQTLIEIEIGDEYLYSATDFTSIVSLAARNGCSLVMVAVDEIPTRSFTWNMMANSARRLGVPFGLRLEQNPSSSTLISAVYSLASEGGSILHFDEETMKPQKAWALFQSSVESVRTSNPNRNIAVIFPRTSVAASDDETFERIVSNMREYLSFDVIDESELGSISSSQYQVIIAPWGTIWQQQSLERLESLTRGGSALLVRMDDAWRTPNNDLSINERLFSGKLEMRNGEWKVVPRTNKTVTKAVHPNDAADRRDISIGEQEDQPFLSGKWSDPENQTYARRFGMPFRTFRWFRERALVALPVIPNRDYQLEISGYVADQHPIDVYVNSTQVGTISGPGIVRWSYVLDGVNQPRDKNVEVMLRGQEWNTGTVLGDENPTTVSMAVNRVALLPVAQEPSAQAQDSPQFKREQLRGAYLREVGRGVSLILPDTQFSDSMFFDLLSAVVADPKILDPRFNFQTPPDGESNRVFVSGQTGANLYLNLNDTTVMVGRKQSLPVKSIPPLSVYYSY